MNIIKMREKGNLHKAVQKGFFRAESHNPWESKEVL